MGDVRSGGTPHTLQALLAPVERLPLAMTPTPLLPAPALASALGLPPGSLLLKMDAWTGFGLGGNKVRKLEYELSPSRVAGVTCLITAGGPQSNHCRVTAAAAAHLGLECILVVNGAEPGPPTGNALLHRLLGAEIRPVDSREERIRAMEDAAREVEARGGRALRIPLGASTPLGALGHVRAAAEFLEQLEAVEREAPLEEPVTVVVSSSSGGTLAGLLLGLHLAGRLEGSPLRDHRPGLRILAVSADVPAQELSTHAHELASDAHALLRDAPFPRIPFSGVGATDAYVGPGYGLSTPGSRRALELFARRAGVVLDPVYTAKAAAALVDIAGRRGAGTLVFWHTGGHPATLAAP